MRIYKEFAFDAAHHLPHVFPAGHPNHRLHGHSYRVRLTLEGEPDPESGLIRNLGDLVEWISILREALDHRYLNEDVPGLEKPSIETIAVWIWRRLKPDLPELAQVGVYRDSAGEGCEYEGGLE
ncbi:MAG: 6-carboxytetrahydropterin synthase [Pseudomonadota bacterium]